MAASLVRQSLRIRLQLSLLSPLVSVSCHHSGRRYSVISSCSPVLRGAACPARPKLSLALLQRSFASRARSDESLAIVLEEEIKDAESESESESESSRVSSPKGFPFEITDNPDDECITLKRKYGDEAIKISVSLNTDEYDDEEGEEEKNHSDDEGAKGSAVTHISLKVSIDKGRDHVLKFTCTTTPEEMTIDSLSMISRNDPENQNLYQGPPFWDLNENLQNEYYKYLEARGINPSLFEFLQDYMLEKDGRNYSKWLKNMKEFIEA